jgi:hypothetical protein
MTTMKKNIIAFFILTFISCETKSQSGFKFKSRLIPENTYTQSMEMTSTSESEYIADQEFLDILKAKGIKNRTVSKSILKY